MFLRGDPVAELRLAPASVEQDAPAVYGAGTSIKSLDGRPSTSPDAVGTESGADGSVGRRRGLHRLHAQQLLHADHMDGAAAVQTARTYLAGKDRSSSVVMTDVIISELATTARTPNADETTAGMAMMDAFTAWMAMMDAFTAGMAMMDALTAGMATIDAFTAGMAMMDAVTAGMAMMDALTAGMAMMDTMSAGMASTDAKTAVMARTDARMAGTVQSAMESRPVWRVMT